MSKRTSLKSSSLTLIANIPTWQPVKAAPLKYKVRGKSASSYEYNVSRALDTLGLDYWFQFSYLGGHALPGGIVIDFLVFTKPLYTPLNVNGDYWHSGARTAIDELQQAIINVALAGEARPIVYLWGKDTATYEAALSSVRRKIL